MTKTLMACFFVVTLSLPLLCLKVQMYVPLSRERTGLIYKLPLESWVNLLLCSNVRPCFFQNICGVGVPSTLQLKIPEAPATILCSGFISVNLAVGRNNIGLINNCNSKAFGCYCILKQVSQV